MSLKNCHYSLNNLCQYFFWVLASIINWIILVYFYYYWHKINFYQEKIGSNSFNWKIYIAYYKSINTDKNR